jgi:hypothetical protein
MVYFLGLGCLFVAGVFTGRALGMLVLWVASLFGDT